MLRNDPHRHTKWSPGMYFCSIALTGSMIILFSLCSCNSGTNGRYKFQPESMHWLQFRGPQSSGIAPADADPPVFFSADTNLLWKTEIPPGWSSPCIVNDRIFLTGFDQKDSLMNVFAINRENGEMLWMDSIQPHGFYPMHTINSYANPTIASDGERIYAEFVNYGLSTYTLDGEKLWEYPHEVIRHFYGGATSPVLADSLVIIKVPVENKYSLLALHCMNGDSAWLYLPGENEAFLGSTSTPVRQDSMLYMYASDAVIALNLKDRTLAWSLPVSGNAVATPVISDGQLYINTYSQLGEKKVIGENITFEELIGSVDQNNNGTVEQDEFPEDMAVFTRPEIPGMDRSAMFFREGRVFGLTDGNGDGSIDKTEWDGMWKFLEAYMIEHGMMAVSLEGSGDRPADDILWKVNEDSPETPSPLLVNDHVFFIKNGGIVTIIDRKSGEIVLHERLSAPGAYVSSPMLAGNHVYTCSFNGTVSVLSAEDYTVLAQNKLKERIGASPVAVDDVLYVRTDKHLYAFRNE